MKNLENQKIEFKLSLFFYELKIQTDYSTRLYKPTTQRDLKVKKTSILTFIVKMIAPNY